MFVAILLRIFFADSTPSVVRVYVFVLKIFTRSYGVERCTRRGRKRRSEKKKEGKRLRDEERVET